MTCTCTSSMEEGHLLICERLRVKPAAPFDAGGPLEPGIVLHIHQNVRTLRLIGLCA